MTLLFQNWLKKLAETKSWLYKTLKADYFNNFNSFGFSCLWSVRFLVVDCGLFGFI